ncbi:hypothetical protein ABBQ32_007974 [Trebouxia sp. C0010 RCD-2024]
MNSSPTKKKKKKKKKNYSLLCQPRSGDFSRWTDRLFFFFFLGVGELFITSMKTHMQRKNHKGNV